MNKKVISCLAILLMATFISGCTRDEPKFEGSVKKLTLAANLNLAGTLVYVAEDQGYFEKNGIEATIKGYVSGKAAGDALIAGEADISTSAGNVFVSNSFNHADIRVLGTVATVEVKELIARKDKGITTINDLIGKKIGVTEKSGAEFLLGVFLTFNDLSYQDIEIVYLRPPEISKAILNGDIDAVFTWDPYAYYIKKALGDNAISSSGGEEFYFILLTKKDWIKKNPEAAKRFMKALVEAADYIKDNSESTKEFIRKRFDYDSDYIDYSWSKQRFVVILEQAMFIMFEDQARWRIKNKLTDKTEVPNYLDFIFMDVLEQIKPSAVTIIR